MKNYSEKMLHWAKDIIQTLTKEKLQKTNKQRKYVHFISNGKSKVNYNVILVHPHPGKN